MQTVNLLRNIPVDLSQEVVETLTTSSSVRIERIVSRGHHSPPDFWYDQEQHEWVMLVQGAATLRFAADERVVQLQPGDCINIPAHVRHRVDATSAEGETIWLAVFYKT